MDLKLSLKYVWEGQSASYHPGRIHGVTIYPTELQCERFAKRVERLIKTDTQSIHMRINLETGLKHITTDLAYPGRHGQDTIYEANRRAIAQYFGKTAIVLGGVAYMPLNATALEWLNDLAKYPVWDEDIQSEVEQEIIDEYVGDDLIRNVSQVLEDNPVALPNGGKVCLFDVLHIVDGVDPDGDTAFDLFGAMEWDLQVDTLGQAMAALRLYPVVEHGYAYMQDDDVSLLAQWVADRLVPPTPPVPREQLALPGISRRE